MYIAAEKTTVFSLNFAFVYNIFFFTRALYTHNSERKLNVLYCIPFPHCSLLHICVFTTTNYKSSIIYRGTTEYIAKVIP